MSKLDKFQRYSNRVAIYVPSTTNVIKTTDHNKQKAMVDYVLTELSNMCGGATAQDAIGGWVSDTYGLVKEDVTLVYAYTSQLSDSLLDHVADIAEFICQEMSQEAVLVELNNDAIFVEGGQTA